MFTARRSLTRRSARRGAARCRRVVDNDANDVEKSDGPRFRAFFAFCPRCLNAFRGWRTAGPLRIHTGELDDWTPASECAELAAMLKRGGNDVEATVYPGAYHAFDSVGAPAYRRLANVQNWATGRLLYGATVGYRREATEAAREKVRAELTGLVEKARPATEGS